jgi:Skp family chaperone for outer membrane proteins
MKSIVLHTLLATAIGLCATSAIAQDFRIGFVNTDRIFRESNPAKAAQTKLEQEFSKREIRSVLTNPMRKSCAMAEVAHRPMAVASNV